MMSNFNVLAIDVGLKTGWSTLIDGKIESGVQDFTKKRGESNGMVFIRFNFWLKEMQRNKFNLLIYEKVHHRGGYATELLVGLTTRIQEFATKINAEYEGVHTGTLKKYITGHGKASKEDMINWFKDKEGRDPIDDNEADAYALLFWAMAQYGE